jgi:class 3 adenylate cyclase
LIAESVRAFYDPRRKGREISLAREQRRLAAIITADVVGYSRLMGRDESGTLARLQVF